MIDPYAREERIAIRMDSGMTEREAIRLTDAEIKPADLLKERIETLAVKQKHDKPAKQLRPPVVPFVERGEK
jgi:hypothetical protein